MSQFIGMIPEEVDEFASALDAKAGEIEDTLSTLSSKLSATTWVGTDFTRFQDAWQGTISQNLTTAATQLRDAATAARNNAEQQRQTSA